MKTEKTKFDYEIEAFNQSFHAFKDKKIVVYGTGRLTATLIEYNTQFNIIGLCDRDETLIGQKVYGLPVLSKKEAEKQADLVIINTGDSYWNTIYKRISDWKVPIYFRNGEQAEEKKINDEDLSYWQTSFKELLETAKQYQVVSFDIFDTLIMRKAMSPNDVFHIVEEKLADKWGTEKARDYVFARSAASSRLNNPSLEDLFRETGQIAGWSEEECKYVMNLEIQVERELIIARTDMVRIYENLCQKADVYFVSDMYYSAAILHQFLEQAGIHADQRQIIVSCDQGKDKVTGTLWKWYKENVVGNRNAFHIGDNYKSDYIMPKKYGIDAYYIMNVQDMLAHSSLKAISDQVVSLQSSIITGCICARLFNSPFALNKSRGKLIFKNDVDAGYAVMGALAFNFAVWLAWNAKRDHIEQLIFFARDGYLSYRQYKYLASLLPNEKWAEAMYLEISRRAMWGAGAIDSEGIYQAAKFPYKGNARDFLKDRFGIEIQDSSLEKIYIPDIQKDKHSFIKFLSLFQNQLVEHALMERENYLQYVNSFQLGNHVAIVDSSLYGSTQYYLQRLLGRKFKGYYMCACLDESNTYIPENDMTGCFQKQEDKLGKHCAVNNYVDFVESFYTAPNGMVVCIGPDGEPIYGKSMSNQKHFHVRERMQEGILIFFDEIVGIYDALGLDIYQVDTIFADNLLRVFMEGGAEPTENMRNGFYYDNGVMYQAESKMWD